MLSKVDNQIRFFSPPATHYAPRERVTKERTTMCLGVPMQVKTIENEVAMCEIDGVQREASLMMLDDVKIGDYVLIHAGFAIEKIDDDEAQLTLKALREALDMGLTAE
jgi:hydrogenase expression/formation protein HypC